MDDWPIADDASEDEKMEESDGSEPRDRLSELPDCLILFILSFLPMRDVFRTTLLSKRWKDLWTTISCLNFSDDGDNSDRFLNFVNQALILWKGTKILKFDIVYEFYPPDSSDLDSWLSVAMENEVEELTVNLVNDDDWTDNVTLHDDSLFWAPQFLFSCSSIRKLHLVFCNLKIHGNVHWSQLKSLRIEGVCLSEHVVNQILSGAPQLEVLMLLLMESNQNLNVQSSSLKKLRIEKYVSEVYVHVFETDDDVATDTVLRIWAPNVEMLEISGVPYSKCLLMNISSVTNATLGFYVPTYYDEDELLGIELVGEMLRQVFQSICNVEKLTLSDWCIKMLREMKKKDMHAPLSNARFLKLYASAVDEILSGLENFPMLTMLVLELKNLEYREICCYNSCLIGTTKPVVPKFDAENCLESTTEFPNSYLLHLRTVEINWILNDNSIFPFIANLLKYARVLEKIMLRAKMTPFVPESLSVAEQILLSMPRSSPTAEVIFLERN